MRVLITGGAGFIGSHTADVLLDNGYQVRILDNLSDKTHFGNWPDYLNPEIEKIKGDVRNRNDLLKALTDVDYVIHLAALMDLLPQFSDFVDVNIKSTALIYELIVRHKLPIRKIICASSQFVYGEGRWSCIKHGEVFPKQRPFYQLLKGNWDPVCPIGGEKIEYLANLETHCDPPNQYAISKYSQELISLKLGWLYQIPSVALRYSIVHGPRQSFKSVYSGALRIFTLNMLNNKKPVLYEDGKQLRDYVSVYDVARANLHVMENEKANYQVFNVGGGKAYTLYDLVKMVAAALNREPNFIVSGEFRLGDIRHAVSDITKLKELGWEPKMSEEETIKDYVNWIKLQNIDKRLLNKSENVLLKSGVIIKANLDKS